MNNRYLAALVAGACISLASITVDAQANHVNIMPFGDSMTARGTSPQSSYRYWLWVDLTNAGFLNFDFIGNQNGVTGGGSPANYWPDQNYEGGDGLDTAGGLALTASDAAGRTPDIVLLELGDNDIFDSNFSPATTETNLVQIMEDFAADNGNVIILIAKITRFTGASSQENADLTRVSAAISRAASQARKAGVRVRIVSLAGYNPHTMSSDGTHPNPEGEKYIARQFFIQLRPLLRRM